MNIESLIDPHTLLMRITDVRHTVARMVRRDAAWRLGVTDAELLSNEVGGSAVRLDTDWEGILQRLGALGQVRGLTQNAHAVIETGGTYAPFEMGESSGRILDGGIDLRLAFSRFLVAFALREESPHEVRRSVRFFDYRGDEVHEVALGPESDVDAFEQLVAAHASEDQERQQAVAPAHPIAERPDHRIDADALLEGWETMRETHELADLLAKVRASRRQAFRLLGASWAYRVGTHSHRVVLQKVADMGLPITVVVGNRCTSQAHGGRIDNLRATESSFHVLDEDFDFHLHEAGVVEAWVVRKPTTSGDVTSLELYDAEGRTVVRFFAQRKAGEPDASAWREILEALDRVPRPRRTTRWVSRSLRGRAAVLR